MNDPRCRTNPRLTNGIEDLAEAIRAWAKGWLPTEAAAELLIGHRGWLLREDFLQAAVEVRWEPFRNRQVAVVDFAAAAEAVQGVLPCSDGSGRCCWSGGRHNPDLGISGLMPPSA